MNASENPFTATQDSSSPNKSDDSAENLVQRLRSGNDAAYETLVRDYGGRMLATARRFLPRPDDSADAVQDAFISVFQSIHQFESNCKLSTWLHRITVNACLMRIRSQNRHPTASIDDLLPKFDSSGHHVRKVRNDDETWSRVMRAENSARVRECIGLLPEPYRVVLLLRDIEELDTEETAQVLDVTPGNVKTRLHRARQCLRVLLEERFSL